RQRENIRSCALLVPVAPAWEGHGAGAGGCGGLYTVGTFHLHLFAENHRRGAAGRKPETVELDGRDYGRATAVADLHQPRENAADRQNRTAHRCPADAGLLQTPAPATPALL